mmetsp:Transcript_34501/g.40635  ORF Transcript_34501/g.40635 Transcript_34501/m.40635 type:complete len:84 (+) Transcript_34501:357-608(+)
MVQWLSVEHKAKRSESAMLQSPLYCGQGKTLLDIFKGVLAGRVKSNLVIINPQDAVFRFFLFMVWMRLSKSQEEATLSRLEQR